MFVIQSEYLLESTLHLDYRSALWALLTVEMDPLMDSD